MALGQKRVNSHPEHRASKDARQHDATGLRWDHECFAQYPELARPRAPELRIEQSESKCYCVPWSRSVGRHVPSGLDETVDVLRSDFEDAANSQVDRQLLLIGFPVENHLRFGSDEPSVAELVSNKRLKKQRVGLWPSRISGERDWIVG